MDIDVIAVVSTVVTFADRSLSLGHLVAFP